MKRYLGLDLGSKTLGVSISETGIIAGPLTTIRFHDNDYATALKELLIVIAKKKINVLILGLPKHMNNDIGVRGQISVDFKEMIMKNCLVEVVLWDERLSSQAVIKTMIEGNVSRKQQKEKKDEMAAVLILQSYLDFKGEY